MVRLVNLRIPKRKFIWGTVDTRKIGLSVLLPILLFMDWLKHTKNNYGRPMRPFFTVATQGQFYWIAQSINKLLYYFFLNFRFSWIKDGLNISTKFCIFWIVQSNKRRSYARPAYY